ncbi:MAG: GyrI-like domain-containing protein [Chloroflexi bacterium]|nr:GyrI-like domain-containing protein [Chloroflexota bacterium]
MSDLEVRIVKLEPIKAARFHAFSRTPEHDAWAKMQAWAEPKGWLEAPRARRIFGFNNPNPSPGSPNYGYEFWVTLLPGDQPEEGVQVIEFAGGTYAVTRCAECGPEGQGIPKAWQRLVAWQERSKHRHARHQWLEEHISGSADADMVLNLYMPIA